MPENNRFDMAVDTIALVLALVSVVLILVGLTDIGQVKTFRFLIGWMAMVTAIAYSFQTRGGMRKFAVISIWLLIASMHFVLTAWPLAR